jgi:hypothetical protein
MSIRKSTAVLPKVCEVWSSRTKLQVKFLTFPKFARSEVFNVLQIEVTEVCEIRRETEPCHHTWSTLLPSTQYISYIRTSRDPILSTPQAPSERRLHRHAIAMSLSGQTEFHHHIFRNSPYGGLPRGQGGGGYSMGCTVHRNTYRDIITSLSRTSN